MSARFLGVVVIAVVTLGLLALQEDPHPASDHRESTQQPAADELVARVNDRLRDGSSRFDETRGYLSAVLDALGVRAESQALVFSKTSRQHARISSATPRGIYFNDRAAVGWVPGADELEIALFDSAPRGARFFTLSQISRPMTPHLLEGTKCFECHTLPETGGLQGLLLRSVAPHVDGGADGGIGSEVIRTNDVDDRTPFARRWNGWYVSGDELPADLLGVRPAFDARTYLSSASDVVALLVLGHQVEMTNRLLRMANVWRQAPQQGERDRIVNEVVDYMLFAEAVPLPGPLRGDTQFAAAFQAGGKRDSQGRSLRDLDLDRRLFRYPCSFMIQSPLFESLPGDARQAVYARLSLALSAPHVLSEVDRRAIIDILRATVSDLPATFGQTSHAGGSSRAATAQ